LPCIILRTCHALYPAPNALELLPLLVQIFSCSHGDAGNGELDQSITSRRTTRQVLISVNQTCQSAYSTEGKVHFAFVHLPYRLISHLVTLHEPPLLVEVVIARCPPSLVLSAGEAQSNKKQTHHSSKHSDTRQTYNSNRQSKLTVAGLKQAQDITPRAHTRCLSARPSAEIPASTPSVCFAAISGTKLKTLCRSCAQPGLHSIISVFFTRYQLTQ
jgi:hypothetical protein